MQSKAVSVEEYLNSLPEDRRAALSAVREVIRENLPDGYEEVIQYGMIGYVVPHSIYPAGYHCDPKQPVPFAHLCSQKNYMSLYLMCLYLSPEMTDWFLKAYAESGKKLDMGKSCVRFKKLQDLPLDVIGQAIAQVPVGQFLEKYVSRVPLAKPRRRKEGAA